jgi:hypothetical protein
LLHLLLLHTVRACPGEEGAGVGGKHLPWICESLSKLERDDGYCTQKSLLSFKLYASTEKFFGVDHVVSMNFLGCHMSHVTSPILALTHTISTFLEIDDGLNSLPLLDPLPPHSPPALPRNVLLHILSKSSRSTPSPLLSRKSTAVFAVVELIPRNILRRWRVCQLSSWPSRVILAFLSGRANFSPRYVIGCLDQRTARRFVIHPSRLPNPHER